MNERVLISGASIAGIAAAYWLAGHGFRPTVVERAAGPRGGGNGVDLRGLAVDVVDRMGILPQVRAAAADVRGMKFVDAGDRTIARIEIAGASEATLLAGVQLTRASGRRLALQKGFATIGATKAALAVAGTAATAYAAYCGNRIAKAAAEAENRGEPIEVMDTTTPTEHTPQAIAKWQRQQRLVQYLSPVLAGANIAAGSQLAQSYRTGAAIKGALGRLLPG